jgi:hypothetical protein
MKCYIYGLKDPISESIRYVGQTIRKPSYRYRDRISEAKNSNIKTKKTNWIKKLLKNNLKPELIILEEIESNTLDLANNKEIYWINYYKKLGNKLTNQLLGGRNNPQRIRKPNLKIVYSFDEITGNIKSYKSIKEAALFVGCNPANIPKAIYIKGRCKKLFWSYKPEFNKKTSKKCVKIAVYNNSFYKEFNSIWEAIDSLNIPRTCRSRVCYRLNDGLPYYGMYFKRI